MRITPTTVPTEQLSAGVGGRQHLQGRWLTAVLAAAATCTLVLHPVGHAALLVGGTLSRDPRVSYLSWHPYLRARQTGRPDSIAVLIDGEEISPVEFGPILAAVGQHGKVVVRRIYANVARLLDMNHTLGIFDIDPVLMAKRQVRPKDFALRISWDAAVFALAPSLISECKDINAVALVTDELDYLEVFRQFQALRGKHPHVPRAYLVLCDLPGIGVAEEVRQAAKDLGVEIITYEITSADLGTKVILNGDASKVMVDEQPMPKQVPNENDLRDAAKKLTDLGYMAPEETNNGYPSMKAICKFFHTNSLGSLVIYPEWRAPCQCLSGAL